MWDKIVFSINSFSGKICIVSKNNDLYDTIKGTLLNTIIDNLESQTNNFIKFTRYNKRKYFFIILNIILKILSIFLLSVLDSKESGLYIMGVSIILLLFNFIYLMMCKNRYFEDYHKSLREKLKIYNDSILLKRGLCMRLTYNPFGFIIQKIPTDANLYLLIYNNLTNSYSRKDKNILNSSTSPVIKKKIEHDFILPNNSDLSKFNSNFNNKSENINFQNISRFTKH